MVHTVTTVFSQVKMIFWLEIPNAEVRVQRLALPHMCERGSGFDTRP
jgi:hypothetical protein